MSWPPKENTLEPPPCRDLNEESLMTALLEIERPWQAYTGPSFVQLMNETARVIKRERQRWRGNVLVIDDPHAEHYEPHQRSLTKEK